jgi:hypothetical protein
MGSGSPITVTGLTNGTSYTFTVTADNSAGTGPASAPSNPVVPAGLPDAPSNVTAASTPHGATISFTPPADNGSPINSYTVTASPGGRTMVGRGSPLKVSGLTNGKRYTFTVAATNGVGTGPESDPSNAVIPAGVPGAPRNVHASAAHGTAKVSFTSPSSNGAPITSYTVMAMPGRRRAIERRGPITIRGLINGKRYRFTVSATNKVGTGPSSKPSNTVIPRKR